MLTAREKATYDFIQSYSSQHEMAPTASEIADFLKITSRGVVHRYIKSLESKGLIRLHKGKWRNIEVVNRIESGAIPLLGSIAAGEPIEAINEPEVIEISSIFSGPGRYALKVKGDSMIEEGIFDGDIVICQSATTARSGQIVVALVDMESATLKRLEWNDDHTIALIPANSAYKTQIYPAQRVKVQGIFIGLLRYSE
ncbi:transcriptional repressor LexA [Gammaproteobacteria bacterium]|nr:transcriptional repressor LexA [Gammaproteobacteria bacterium]